MVLRAVPSIFLLLISISSHAQIEKWDYYSRQSHIYFDQDRFTQAELYADSALTLAVRSAIPDSLAHAYRWMYQIHLAKKEFEKALVDLRMSYVYRDSVMLAMQLEKEAGRKDIQAKEQETHRLELTALRAEILELKTMADQDRRNLLTIFFSMLALLMIVIFIFYRKNARLIGEMLKCRGEIDDLQAFSSKLHEVLYQDVHQSLQSLETEIVDPSGNQRVVKSENLKQSVQKLRATLNHVIEWVGYQAHTEKAQTAEFDCRVLVEEIIEKYRDQFSEKHITSEIFIPFGQLAFADRTMIGIVMEHLISNAIHFTKPGGRITFFSGKNEDLVTLGIKDSGIGMSEEKIQEIFRVNKHAYTGNSAVPEGMGLGLVLSRDLVERNGGKIYVESVAGEGSTFYFSVPGKKSE